VLACSGDLAGVPGLEAGGGFYHAAN